jgi:hypothetical protein
VNKAGAKERFVVEKGDASGKFEKGGVATCGGVRLTVLPLEILWHTSGQLYGNRAFFTRTEYIGVRCELLAGGRLSQGQAQGMESR